MSYGSKRRVAKAVLLLLSLAGIGLVLVPLAVLATVVDYAADREPGGLVSPVMWLLVVVGAALAAGHTPKAHGAVPKPGRVRRLVRTCAWAGAAATCSLPAGPLWPVLAVGVGAVVAWALRRATTSAFGFTSWAETARTGAGLAWRQDRPLVLGAAAAALALGTVLSASGVWAAGLLAALLALAPSRLHASRAAAIEQERGEVERSLAGVLTGSEEWGPERAARGAAPVTVGVDDDLTVTAVVLPLPATWHGSREGALAEEVERRLEPFATQGWRVTLEQSRTGRGAAWWARAVPRPPAPVIAWADWPAAQLPIPAAYEYEEVPA